MAAAAGEIEKAIQESGETVYYGTAASKIVFQRCAAIQVVHDAAGLRFMVSTPFNKDLREKTGMIQILQDLQCSVTGDRMTAQDRFTGVLVGKRTVGSNEIPKKGDRKDLLRHSGKRTSGGRHDKDPGFTGHGERG